mmetsp:Transcript_119566/g.338403  ORF Transcript_119566/g.338403 Transcript_119566/m.338403 type:complete len:220 (-) Transcript_119566:29-688(-)
MMYHNLAMRCRPAHVDQGIISHAAEHRAGAYRHGDLAVKIKGLPIRHEQTIELLVRRNVGRGIHWVSSCRTCEFQGFPMVSATGHSCPGGISLSFPVRRHGHKYLPSILLRPFAALAHTVRLPAWREGHPKCIAKRDLILLGIWGCLVDFLIGRQGDPDDLQQHLRHEALSYDSRVHREPDREEEEEERGEEADRVEHGQDIHTVVAWCRAVIFVVIEE